MSGIEQNSSIPSTQKSENIASPPSSQQADNITSPSPSQQSEQPAVEKSEDEIPKAHITVTTNATNDEKPKLLSPVHLDFVVQIANNNTTGEEESFYEDQSTYNLTRKLSNVEEDVCYPLRPTNKNDEIDYDSLEGYIEEEKFLVKNNEGLSSIESEPKKSSLSRRVSEFGERIKVIIFYESSHY